MKNLGIPIRFKDVDYNNDVLPLIKESVEKFRTSRKGLYLFGKNGTGKTHTAYAICKEMAKRGFEVRAFKAIDILKMAKEDMNFENREMDFDTNGDIFFGSSDYSNGKHINFLDGLNRFKGLLFIDDFGTEKGTEWVLETFYTIIDKKYEDLVPMIITSNCDLNELGQKMGDRIASRIAQMCDVILMPGQDRRLIQHMNIQNHETN